MEKTYSWKAGAQFPVKASVAADTIKSLQKTLGKDNVTAVELLDASRDENAPLHSCFEWNDDIAAEQFRICQARHLITSIEVTIITNDTPVQTRGFVNVNTVAPKKQGEYVSVEVAFSKDDYRRQVLCNVLSELRAFQRKYAVYQELSGVFKAIDTFADALK